MFGIVPVNHISASLTTQPQRRRFAPLQITVVLAGFAYVLRITWPIRAVNIVAALTGSHDGSDRWTTQWQGAISSASLSCLTS